MSVSNCKQNSRIGDNCLRELRKEGNVTKMACCPVFQENPLHCLEILKSRANRHQAFEEEGIELLKKCTSEPLSVS